MLLPKTQSKNAVYNANMFLELKMVLYKIIYLKKITFGSINKMSNYLVT